jgi:hypothetical protein
MKHFIYLKYQYLPRLFSIAQDKRKMLHHVLKENKVYEKVGLDLVNVMSNGILLWIILMPIVGVTNPLFIPSYGLTVWYGVKLWKKVKNV